MTDKVSNVVHRMASGVEILRCASFLRLRRCEAQNVLDAWRRIVTMKMPYEVVGKGKDVT
jgi:hypothetical protein